MPYYPKTDTARIREDIELSQQQRRPWEYWARQQKNNLRAALGETLWDWLEQEVGEVEDHGN